MGWTTFYKGRYPTTKQWFEKNLTCDLRDWMSQPEGTPFAQCPLIGYDVCLKSSVLLREGYAAVRRTYLPDTGHPKAGTSQVWCAVYLFEHYTKKSPHWRNYGHDFGYKDMDESVGPTARCPKDILDLLTPLPEPTLTSAELTKLREQVDALGAQLSALAEANAPADQRQDMYARLAEAQSAWHAGDPHLVARNWRQACRDNLAERAAKPKVSKGCLVRFETPLVFGSGTKLSELRWSGKGGLFYDRYSPSFETSYEKYRIRRWRTRQYTVVKETT